MDLHLITFASRPQVVPLPPADRPLPPLRAPGITADRSASNLQAALQLAYGLYPPGVLRRALILSDGNQTEGDVLAEAQEALRRGVRVDVQPLRTEGSEEVLVRELRLLGERAEGEDRETEGGGARARTIHGRGLSVARPPGAALEAYAVSRLVSTVGNDGPELIEPLHES